MAPKLNLAIGGQALIEGVMIRSPHYITMSVRRPDGVIETLDQEYIPYSKRYALLSLPIMRGMTNFIEMMVIGMKAINWSSQRALADDAPPKSPHGETKSEWMMLTFTIILSLAFTLFLFKYIPLLITDFLHDQFPVVEQSWLLFNLLDGCIKIAIFLLYVLGISKLKDVYRVFQYHGAEHKSIFAYEHDATLTPASVRTYQKEHPRCGTSFILIVFTISILAYTVIPRQELFLENFALRIAALPFIAGLSYELLKLAGKYQDSWFGRLLSKPGMWFQYVTTKEPDNQQLEVAIATLQRTLALEAAKQA